MQEQGGDTPPRSSLPATVHPHLLGSPQDSTDDEAGLQERGYQGMNYTSPSPSGSYTLRPVVPAYYPPHRRGPSLPPLRRDAPFEHGTPLEDISQDRLRMYATPPPGPYASPMRQGGSGPWSTSPGYQPYTPIHPLRLVSPQNVDWDEGEAGPSTWAGGARESEYSELPQADDGWENRWGRQMGSRTGPTESYTRGEASGQARYANPRLHTPPRQASTYDWRSPQDHPDNFARPSYFTQPQPMGTGRSTEQQPQSSFGSAGSSSEGSSFRSQPRELYQAPNYPYDSPQHVEPRLPLGIPPHGSGEDYLPSLSYGRPMPPGYLESGVSPHLDRFGEAQVPLPQQADTEGLYVGELDGSQAGPSTMPESTSQEARDESPSRKTQSRGEKVPIACDFCKKRKLKCTGERPMCAMCVKHRQPACRYAPKQRRRGPGKAPRGTKKHGNRRSASAPYPSPGMMHMGSAGDRPPVQGAFPMIEFGTSDASGSHVADRMLGVRDHRGQREQFTITPPGFYRADSFGEGSSTPRLSGRGSDKKRRLDDSEEDDGGGGRRR